MDLEFKGQRLFYLIEYICNTCTYRWRHFESCTHTCIVVVFIKERGLWRGELLYIHYIFNQSIPYLIHCADLYFQINLYSSCKWSFSRKVKLEGNSTAFMFSMLVSSEENVIKYIVC